jgi:hypothetical protein
MILQELLGIKKFTGDTITAFLNKLIRDGKIKVRNGSFAFVVIPTDADYVYKVWTHDDGWWEYLEYIGDHPGNEHLLKTKSRIKKIKFTFKRPEDFDTDLHVVKLEKLAELETDPEAYGQVKGLMLFLRKHNVHKLTKDDIPKIQEWIHEKEFVEPPPASFIETTIDVLQSAVISIGDFHTGNVMLRGKTLVITDPCYLPEGGGSNIKISAADLLQGRFYGKYSNTNTKNG